MAIAALVQILQSTAALCKDDFCHRLVQRVSALLETLEEVATRETFGHDGERAGIPACLDERHDVRVTHLLKRSDFRKHRSALLVVRCKRSGIEDFDRHLGFGRVSRRSEKYLGRCSLAELVYKFIAALDVVHGHGRERIQGRWHSRKRLETSQSLRDR